MTEPLSKGRRGASRERMLELVEIRREKGKTDPQALGAARPRLSATERAELQQRSLLDLREQAIRVLEEQLRSKDQNLRQRAAQALLAWEAKQEEDQPSKVIYLTRFAAEPLSPDDFRTE